MPTAILAIALAALAAAFPAPASTQSPTLEGSYVLVSPGRAEIDRAIETAIARMNFVTRPIARGRLRRTNVPYGRLRVSVSPSEIVTTADDGSPVVTPPSGTFVKWEREDGETFDVATRWQGDTLSQTFRADDGQRDNLYTLGPDGRTLTLAVTLSSPRLPNPLRYSLTYRKE